ncbi:hypothetical protein HF325_003278 [Metschnikowia pulcherrima]|uniref:Uncharacterized protein n=1 Tax=Metschnikowia pulcherrima TaxID=27326 RepID=A0A8H7GS48_9ASCO|nr:hypothetical protein HF325_003278 [Metschnikowia pulcherrima]
MNQTLKKIEQLKQKAAEIEKAKMALPHGAPIKRFPLKKKFYEQEASNLATKKPFKTSSNNEIALTAFDDIKNIVHNAWKTCYNGLVIALFREHLKSLMCYKAPLPEDPGCIRLPEDPWVNVGDVRNARDPQWISEKLTARLRRLWGRDLDSLEYTLTNRYSQVVFDAEFDRKWPRGFCPEIDLSSGPNSANFMFPRCRKRTYTRLAPYGSATMYSSLKSAPLLAEEYAELHRESTPVDVNRLLEEFKGLEAVYITDEAHFFINNFGEKTSKEEKRKLVHLVLSLVAQTASTRASRGVHSLVSKVASIFRTESKLVMLHPPSVGRLLASLRPLLLVKGSKLCLQLPETHDSRHNGREPTIFELADEDSIVPEVSPPVQASLRELKLVQRRSQRRNSFVVPVWNHFVQGQAKLKNNGDSAGKSQLVAAVKRIQARPLANRMGPDTEVFI